MKFLIFIFLFFYINIFGLFVLKTLFTWFKNSGEFNGFSPVRRVFFKYATILAFLLFVFSLFYTIALIFYGKSLPIAFEGVSFFIYQFFIAWNYGMIFFFPIFIVWFIVYLVWKILGIFIEKVRYSDFNMLSIPVVIYLLFFSVLWFLLQISTLEPQIKNIKIDLKKVDNRELKIVQISDTHIGNIINEKSLDIIANKINSLDADILVMTGDIIDNNNDFIPVFEAFYKKIHSFPGGVYGVIGNHDHIDSSEPLIQSYRRMGITLLNNSSTEFTDRSGRLWQIAGVDYPYPHFGDRRLREKTIGKFYEGAFRRINKKNPVILLIHDPKDSPFLLEKAVKDDKRIDIILAGHTHAGQICIPFFIEFLEKTIMPFIKGHYKVNGSGTETSDLYINAGTGHWMPMRINCNPEITRLILK